MRGLGWLGVRTAQAPAMTAFYRVVLQLEVILERPGATWFRLGDGTEVHVYGPGSTAPAPPTAHPSNPHVR